MTPRPKLLDLFCGAGGAAMGYHRAGFEVVGVDIKPQKHYPFEFHQADAMTYPLEGFDVIHASPPCQAYSMLTKVHGHDHPTLVSETRQRIKDKIFVLENVIGAPLSAGFLCGSSFKLGAVCRDGQFRQLRRHRLFESSAPILFMPCNHYGEPVGVYGHGGGQAKTVWNGGKNRGYMGTLKERKEAMEIDWMDVAELAEAIPPAYTEFIGKQLLLQLSQ